MSRVVVFSAFGAPDVLAVVDRDPPVPRSGQVRVAVKAAGVQPFDAHYRAGRYGEYVPATFPQTLGNEFAGVVDAGVDDLPAGSEVLGWVWASAYAEHVVVPADQVVRKPPAMPWAVAGVLSASGQTAHTALERLGVERGHTVLIHAAAGGVGTFAVQLARELGATVVGTASPRNHEYLRGLGVAPVAYGHGLVDRVRAVAPQGIDAALDAHGGDEAVETSVALVADRDRIGTLTAYGAVDRFGIRLIGTERSVVRLRALTDFWERGRLEVVVQQMFPLEHVVDAHREVEGGHVRGKLVLTV